MKLVTLPLLLRVALLALALPLSTTASVRADAAPESEPYQIGAGDQLAVVIHPGGQADSIDLELTVASDGTIDVVHAGRMKVAGLTASEIASRIKGRLVASQVFLQPFVSVNVSEYLSQGVNVAGAVNKQGRIYLTRPTRLLDVLAMAEGVDEETAGPSVVVHRQGLAEPLRIARRDLFSTDMARSQEANIRVLAGDNVHVPVKAQFCVSGAVKAPDCYPLEEPVPLSQALAMAGGVDPETADRSNVIVRAAAGGETRVDLEALDQGRGAAPMIGPDDQVVVGAREKTRFCIRGEVKKEDCYEYELGLTLDGAISKAGGFSPDTADSEHVQVSRVVDGKPELITVDFTQAGEAGSRFRILRDDQITIPKRDCLVTVRGSVKLPGQYPLKTGMTISDAIAAAGDVFGDQRWGSLKNVTLTREGESVREVNVKQILDGKAEDILMRCGDRIHVKPRKM